ncbi:MAG: glycosyltransferase [Baekduia sp.]
MGSVFAVIVAVDGRRLAAGRGVSRVATRVCEELSTIGGIEVRAVTPSRAARAASALTGRPTLIAAADADVAWLPAPGPIAAGAPYVLTVNDLSWLDRPADFTHYERLWHRLMRFPRLLRAAAAVTCIDASVADDLESRFGVGATVVEPGVDAPPAGIVPFERPRPYFLFVGALEPRKGLDVLADAWRRAAPDADLLIAGEGRTRPDIGELLGHVSDEQLHRLYAGAKALIVPSLLEGYGLTPREAAAHGVPSIVSDLPSLRLPGTLRFPAGDAGALAAAIGALPTERANLVAALEPPRPWSAVAADMAAVFERVVR